MCFFSYIKIIMKNLLNISGHRTNVSLGQVWPRMGKRSMAFKENQVLIDPVPIAKVWHSINWMVCIPMDFINFLQI